VKKVYGMARYGTSRSYRSSGSKRGYAGSGRRRSYRKMAGRGARKLKFATVGFSRDIEKKYRDKLVGIPGGTKLTVGSPYGGGGAGWFSNNDSWVVVQGGGAPPSTPGPNYSGFNQDLLKGLPPGTTATTRIGNVVNVKYVKGSITVNANVMKNTIDSSQNAQYGESELTQGTGVSLEQFVRTTWRIAIVKDMQVNSTAKGVGWTEVFAGTVVGAEGVFAELNVDNMGRFRVLMDKLVEVDADDPQKTLRFHLKNVGRVRYNGSAEVALTDKGIYIVAACLTVGMNANFTNGAEALGAGTILVNSRMCFTDC
jgi:hypothetical protein